MQKYLNWGENYNVIAHFYIISESFIQNNQFSKEEIELRIEALAKDYDYIRLHREKNKIYVNYNIYNVPFLNNITIQELLYDSEKKFNLERDARNALSQIIEKSEETNLSFDQIKELLEIVDESICHGLIAFNGIRNIDFEDQIIYDKESWLTFRRNRLKKHPRNPDYFIDECRIYFPNLFFHEKNKQSVKSILLECSSKIIVHLSALNDHFKESQKKSIASGANRQQVLDNFSRENNLDEIASLEGNPSRKKDLTFSFMNDKVGQIQKICCEPHLKLPRKDLDDGSYSTNRRIYFHEGIDGIANGRILIGHIGAHL